MGAKRLVFTGKQQVSVEVFDPQPVAADEVRVKSLYTLMSTGTENIVFNRLFDAGTHWDDWVKYPFYPGYSAVGRVIEVGSGVRDLPVGTVVGSWAPHASEFVAPANSVYVVPSGIEAQQAVWFVLAQIAFVGARAARYELGDTAMIIGAGPIGQMAVRWATAAGVGKLVVIDPVAWRLTLAERGGATAGVAKPITECREEVLAVLGGVLPRVVIDVTGNAAVFSAALSLAADFGRVVILGDTGSPVSQHLTSDVIRRGLTIVGAHGTHTTEQWTNTTIAALFFDLVRCGRFDMGGINSHIFTPDNAVDAYNIANTKRGETMGIVFDWTAE
jgi:2-desacetyl-2-hydroxyethyl bacteriochlorophyllide A dehydrogenase